MARRITTALVTAAMFFAVGLALAQEPVGVNEKTPPVDVVGTVTAVSQDEMTVRTDRNEEYKFKLNDQTQRLAGVAVGDRVSVRFKDEWGTDLALNVSRADDTTTDTAKRTTTNVAPADDTAVSAARRTTTPNTTYGGQNLEGTIVAVNANELVIRTDAGERKTFVLTSGMDRTHLIQGNHVRLNYEIEAEKLMARQIYADPSDTMARNTDSSGIPNTASSLPLVALLGVLSILMGSALWLGRSRLV